MGWYLRKSLKIGPLRLNLSKSGIGTSAGITGLRIGTGPRGQYFHAGREGLYYRKSLSSKKQAVEQTEPEGEQEAIAPKAQQGAPAKDWLARSIRRLFRGR